MAVRIRDAHGMCVFFQVAPCHCGNVVLCWLSWVLRFDGLTFVAWPETAVVSCCVNRGDRWAVSHPQNFHRLNSASYCRQYTPQSPFDIIRTEFLSQPLGKCGWACYVGVDGPEGQDGAYHYDLRGQFDREFTFDMRRPFRTDHVNFIQQISAFVIPLLVIIGWM